MVERIYRLNLAKDPEYWGVYGSQIKEIVSQGRLHRRDVYSLFSARDALGLVAVNEDGQAPRVLGYAVGVPLDNLKNRDISLIESHVLHSSGIALCVVSGGVDESEQGGGIGRRLISDMIGHAAIDGYTNLVGIVGAEAVGLYSRMGIVRPHGCSMFGMSRYIGEIDITQKKIVKPFDAVRVSGCGPGSLAMVLDYHGVPVSQEDLWAELGTSRDGGTSCESIVKALRKRGFRSFESSKNTISDLEKELMSGSPPLVMWFSRDVSHLSVVDDIDVHGKVYLKDPAFGGTSIFKADEFRKLWFGYCADRFPKKDGFFVGVMVSARKK